MSNIKGNGCGPKWLHSKIKDILFNWWFEDLCDKHDHHYKIGGKERERRKADLEFLSGMLLSTGYLKWYLKPLAYLQAFTFYGLVRAFGWTRFKYTEDYKR